MDKKYKFTKDNPDDKIKWVDNPETKGEFLFTFDEKKIYNLFRDYPQNLTKEEKEIFDKENPYWKDFLIKEIKKRGFTHIPRFFYFIVPPAPFF